MAQGLTRAAEAERGRGAGRRAGREARRRPAPHRATRCRCRRAATAGGTSSSPSESDDPSSCPCEPMDSEDLLYLLYTSGTTAKPKGIAHTTAGYLVGVATTHHYIFDVKPDSVYWCAADVGWVTGHSYIVYGPLVQRDDRRHVRGRARLPGQGSLVGDRRALRGGHPVHGSDGDPLAHEVGPRARGQARPVLDPAARVGRRADQPRGVDLVPGGDRRRPRAGRGHVVADGDGDDPDHAAAGGDDAEAGLGDEAVPGGRRGGLRRAGERGRPGRRRLSRPAQAVAGDAARDLQGRRALPARRTGRSTRTRTSPATGRGSTRTATSGCWAAWTT